MKYAVAAIFLVAPLALALLPNSFAQDSGEELREHPATVRRPATPPSLPGSAIPRVDKVDVPQPSAKAMRYYRGGNVLWSINQAWGVLIPCLFLFTGLSARIRTWARLMGRKWFFIVGFYWIIFSVFNYVIDLPLDYYEGFVRQHAYGLSNQTFQKWFTDGLKSLMVGIIGGILFLWVPYLLLAKSPRRWWLYTGILSLPFLCFVMLIAPLWIAPLFNTFSALKNKALEAKILALAERAGIEGGRVYEVNKSVDTKAVNAYVNGFLGTKRIVLWDTAIAKLDEDALLCVMGHEMGHYVLGHVAQGILLGSAYVLLTLYVVHRAAGALIGRYRERFGFDRLSDVASLPLIFLLVHLFTLLAAPVENAYTRHIEHEADRFSLEITRKNHAAALAFAKLSEENLSNPRPGLLFKLWRSTHPPLGERIDFCNEYRPWEHGAPLKYGRLFRDVHSGT